jgi:phosphoglycolate phosphatase
MNRGRAAAGATVEYPRHGPVRRVAFGTTGLILTRDVSMRFRAALFDLDGTLLDTLEDIASAANTVLARLGYATHAPAEYRRFIGDGVATLFRRALPPGRAANDEGEVSRCVGGFREEYGKSWNLRTRVYDGIPALLDALSARDLPLGVLSNKPDDFTRLCVAEYLSTWPFLVTLGQREGVPRKPDPGGALEAAQRFELPPSEIVYVGDTSVDMETARGAGMHPVGVAWGFRPAEELWSSGAAEVIATPAELLPLLED